MIERPLTAPEVAEVLGLHVHSVKRISAKDLPYFRVGTRGDRRYEPASIVRYKAARYVNGR